MRPQPGMVWRENQIQAPEKTLALVIQAFSILSKTTTA